jgi:hypothetical protein
MVKSVEMRNPKSRAVVKLTELAQANGVLPVSSKKSLAY